MDTLEKTSEMIKGILLQKRFLVINFQKVMFLGGFLLFLITTCMLNCPICHCISIYKMSSTSKPTLHYFDVHGRGEVPKIVAAASGLEIDIVEYDFQANGASAADKLKAGKIESAHTKAATKMGMDGCGLPIVVHDDLKINQSFAVTNYFANLGPRYPRMNPAQTAIDDMFLGAYEDAMGVAAGVILSGYDAKLVPKVMGAVLTHLTKYIPDKGFVHGYDGPTVSDIVILSLTQAVIPFGATLGDGAADFYAKFPKAVALGERTAEYPPIAKWLTEDKCNLKKLPRASR